MVKTDIAIVVVGNAFVALLKIITVDTFWIVMAILVAAVYIGGRIERTKP